MIAGLLVSAMPADAKAASSRERSSHGMCRRGAAGEIAVRAGRRHFPANAEVSLARTHADNAKDKIKNGQKKRRDVLAMYDISIRADGRKWQPDAGDPVRVSVDLEEPVPVASGANPGVVHLADDGTVEELAAGRYGFTYNADNTAVTAFWFDADGFSVYAIVDGDGGLAVPRRFYHFYGHPQNIEGSSAVRTLPYVYHDESNDVVNVQIVKTGDMLKEPPIPPDIVDEYGNLVSMFEGWYVVSTNARPANAVEGKLDSTSEYFQFVWPVGVNEHRLSFTDAVSVAESEDTDYYVVPLYEHARFLQFNENGYEAGDSGASQRIIDRKLVVINDETGYVSVKVSDVSAAFVNSRQEYFCGWRYRNASGQWTDLLVYDAHGEPQDGYITIDNALFEANGGTVIQLYPLYVPAHFLNFDTNSKGGGATYVGSIFLRSTSDFASVDPSGNREGYDFAGWCAGTVSGGKVVLGERLTDSNGNFIANVTVTNAAGDVTVYTDSNGYIRLNRDTTLYASWVANSSASYRVIVWQQRDTDAKDAADADKAYYYVTHYTSPVVSATTRITDALFTNFTGTRADGTAIGSGTNLATLSGKAEANAANEDFTGFHYARWASTDATVAPDGSTVVNVYYDRDLITLRFCLYDSNQSETIYTTTTSTSGDIYGTDDGENYFTVYYDNGQWYRTRTNGYDYYGKRYNRGNNTTSYYFADSYSGDYYTKSGNNYSRVTNGNYNNNTQYYGIEDGAYFPIYRSANNGAWYKIQSESIIYNFSDPYSGYRYTVSTSHWIVNQTMTGLYGQTLARNGYTWPAERAWKDEYSGSSSDGTSISFLDAFLPTPVGDETFYSSANSSSSGAVINFYKEALDGSWTLVNEYHSGSSSVSFNISDKYNGFEAYQYSKNGGAWTDVGAYNENTGYYGSQVTSVSSTLDIRFKRKEFELIYKDGNNTVYDTGKTVPYESSLAGYNLGINDSRLDWGERDTSVGTFEGWFEDASLTVPFDFGATMPDGKKFLYAKWAPVKYRVIVDPNGGEMQSGDSTWFYLDAGEKVIEYTVTRNYHLDMHNGTHYYHHDLWDPVKDNHTDQYDPSTAGAPRRAYYTTDIGDATDNEVSSPEIRYSYEPEAYSFMGWYEVHGNGTMATDPFNFAEAPNRPVTIRALWRRTDIYTLRYESIDPDGLQPDEVIIDPEEGVEGGYIDDAITTLAKDPTNYDSTAWVWEGWQVVDTYNNNIPLTDIRSPGDIYVVHEDHADRGNTIHFRAVYKSASDSTSRHIPAVTDLILDSNDNAGLAANAALPQHEGRSGTYADGSESMLGGLNDGVWFAGQQNNFSVNLAEYSAMFAHDNGYFLLGWDPLRNVSSLIPTYSAAQTIGADKTSDSENVLYAVWEPEVYIEFVNDTGDDLSGIELYIPSWVEGELFRVNTVTGTYGRETFTAFESGTAVFDLAAGETLRLVLPDAAERDFAVFGSSPYAEGTKLVVTRVQPQIAGQEDIPDVTKSVYPDEHYQVVGTMKMSPTPVQVRFTKSTYLATTDVPVRYFLHDPDGTVTEVTEDSALWDAFDAVKKTLVGINGSTNDIAYLLRKSATEGVHEHLEDSIKDQYGYTTIGIGAATGDFDEWRSITKGEPSGGSYIRFYHEKLEWSRYSHVWNAYEDAAVYVVFYKRIPVHVTVGKAVIGTEEDKDRPFEITATFEDHSKTFEYTVTTTYKKSRTATRSWSLFSGWSEWSGTSWEDCDETVDGVSSTTPVELAGLADSDLFPARSSAQVEFSLKDSERHPITIYFNRDDTAVDSQTSANVDSDPSQSSDLSSSGLGTRETATQTRTYSQTVTFRVTYQYETATILDSLDELFVLTGIGGEAGSGHSGTPNLSGRSYTISSMQGPDQQGFFTYTPLDTAIFTNTRKTGSVTVSKTVVDGDDGDTFPFTVTLGETVVGKDSYTPPAGVHLGPYGKVFSFSLADGGSVTLAGLPAGASYTVEEVAHDNYIATVPQNATGTISTSTTAVGFVNTRKTDLAIAMKDREVIFTGEEQRGHDISSVAGTGAVIDTYGYTVTGLKSGHVLTVEHYVVPHGTAVGGYTGHVENVRFTVLDANDDDRDVTGEYLIVMTPGSLTIEPTPIVVTVTGNQETKTYNGGEQQCIGYTYEITHATTHETVANDNVYVAINPEFQTAWRKDVGRSYMTLLPDRVIVTVPDGMSVSEIVIAANGYLEIVPAPVTVKANDKAKILNRADPPFTATVTGLFVGDTVEYALAREAGEAIGTYAITATGAAQQGNYTVAYEPGTLTVEALNLIQRATGCGVAVSVAVSDELIAALGFDSHAELSAATVGEVMNRVDPNGLRRWENLVTGTATNQLLLSTAVDATSTNMTFRLSMDPARLENLGYVVKHELRKYSAGAWTRQSDATAAVVPAFTLQSEDTTGYYRIVTLITPSANPEITNEIPTTNIVGVLRIASTATHTMAAVPFAALPQDPALNAPVKVEDYIGAGFVEDGDILRLREDGVFKVWVVEGGKFEPYVSVGTDGDAKDVPDAAEGTLLPGRSVWVTRANHSKPFVLVGQFTGEPVEVDIGGASTDESGNPAVGATMVTNPNMVAINVNDIDWGNNPVGGTNGDSIEIPSATDGVMSTRLNWSPTKKLWGKSVPKKVGGRFVQTFVSDFEIPAGLGFWYYRTGGEPFKVTVRNAQELD